MVRVWEYSIGVGEILKAGPDGSVGWMEQFIENAAWNCSLLRMPNRYVNTYAMVRIWLPQNPGTSHCYLWWSQDGYRWFFGFFSHLLCWIAPLSLHNSLCVVFSEKLIKSPLAYQKNIFLKLPIDMLVYSNFKGKWKEKWSEELRSHVWLFRPHRP